MASPIYTKTWSASFPQNIFQCTFYLIYFLKSVLYTHVGIAFLSVASDIFLHSHTHRDIHTHTNIHTHRHIYTHSLIPISMRHTIRSPSTSNLSLNNRFNTPCLISKNNLDLPCPCFNTF